MKSIINTYLLHFGYVYLAISLLCPLHVAAQDVDRKEPIAMTLSMIVQQGHKFFEFDISSDNKFLLTKEHHGFSINIWDLANESILSTAENHNYATNTISSPDFSRMVAYSRNCHYSALNLKNPSGFIDFQPYSCFSSDSISKVILSDNKSLLINSEKRAGFEIWNVDTGKLQYKIDTPCDEEGRKKASLAAISESEEEVITFCSWGKAAALWNLNGKNRLWSNEIDSFKYEHAAFLKDDKTIVFLGQSTAKKSKIESAIFVNDRHTGRTLKSIQLRKKISTFIPLPDQKSLLLILRNEKKKYSTLKGGSRGDYDWIIHKEPAILNLETGELKSLPTGRIRLHDIGSVVLAKDGQSFFGIDDRDLLLKRWHLKTGRVLQTIENNYFGSSYNIATGDDNASIATASRDGKIYLWDGNLLSLNRSLPVNADLDHKHYKDNQIYISRNLESILGISESRNNNYPVWDAHFRMWRTTKGERLDLLTKHLTRYQVDQVAFSKDGRRVAILGYHGRVPYTVEIWDATRGVFLKSLLLFEKFRFRLDYKPKSIAFSLDGRYLAVTAREFGVFDIESERLVSRFGKRRYRDDNIDVAFLPDGEHLVIANGTIELWNWKKRKLIRFFGENRETTSDPHTIQISPADVVAVSSDGERIVTNYLFEGIDVFDTASGQHLGRHVGHSGEIRAIEFLAGDNHVVTSSDDGTLRIWNLNTGYSASLIVYENEWIVYSEDGYFDASPKSGKLIRMTIEKDNGLASKSYRVDQFATRSNRPDLLLERLGLGTPDIIKHYHSLYQRRLKEFGIRENQVDASLINAPKAKIKSLKKDGKWADLVFEVSANSSNLKNYNVYVNDVPLLGARGKPVNGKYKTIKKRIELTYGPNKVEVSVQNELGVESLRDHRTVSCPLASKGNLYFLGFGVSKYKNQNIQLKYAAKDVLDMEAIFGRAEGSFKEVFTNVYTDDEVTVDTIRNAKSFFDTATVDDTVVMFVAGHGLYDTGQSEAYYYLTYDADINRLEKTAAQFELIEELLQGIKPRRKLFLLDTCQSGEFAGQNEADLLARATKRGLKSRGIRKKVLQQSKKKREFQRLATDRRRFIYNDLFRRSGAIVLSSSLGSEWSYESDEIQNGLFTQEVINALTRSYADINQNNQISTEELRDYVTTAVPRASGGLQHPVVDRDNIEMVFSFPIVDAFQ